MGTLKAQAVVDKTVGDPDPGAASSVDELRDAGGAPDAAAEAGSGREDIGDPSSRQAAPKQTSIKRSIVSFLQPSVSAANDDRAAAGRAQRAAQGQRLKYAALLLASALLLIGAIYSLAQSDRFVTDLTVVSFVLILFFLIGLRIESAQGMLRDLAELVENRSVGLDVGVDIEAAEQKVGIIDSAVARTLNRAGELQTMLRAEDLDFERAFAHREARFRAALDEMAVERAAITTNAEKMRAAMEGAHQNLSSDLDAASRKFGQLLNDTGAHLVARIEEQLQKQSAEAIEICVKKLRSSLDGALIRAVEQVDARGASLAALITSKSEEFDEKLLNFKKEVALSLNGQIDDTQKAAAIRIEAMTGCINRLLDRMNSGIAERSESLNQMLATRVLEIASTLKTGKTEMLQTIESATELSSDMTVKSQAANELLQKQIVRLNESVVAPLGALVENLKERSASLTQDLAFQFDGVNGALKDQSHELHSLFDRHITALKGTLAATTATIESVVEENSTAYQSSLEALFRRHQQPLSEEMASVRSEFAAQRKLLAPLITNYARNERNGSAATSEAREGDQVRRASLPTTTPSSFNGDIVREEPPTAVVDRRPILNEPARAPEPDSRSGQSWLTDILARASSADEPAASKDEDDIDANIFGAISANIESLVSSDQAAAAWTAFKRREVSRFNQIYTPQGEIVFRKLKTLLNTDDELKDSVAKYAAQFESLLRDRFDGEDERALLRYLTSPTGKVYTMLAHASDRLS